MHLKLIYFMVGYRGVETQTGTILTEAQRCI